MLQHMQLLAHATLLSTFVHGSVRLSRPRKVMGVPGVHCSVPTTGLDPATGYKEVLHGLEGCKNANPALPNGCMASGPTVGIDQHGLWCGAAASCSQNAHVLQENSGRERGSLRMQHAVLREHVVRNIAGMGRARTGSVG